MIFSVCCLCESPCFHSVLTNTQTESNCPNSYAYAFDESSGTALWNCDSSLQADYTLTFCPYVVAAHVLHLLVWCLMQRF